MEMTTLQMVITVGVIVLATQITRWLPFLVFNEKTKTPGYVDYLGKALTPAIFGMLIVYCLKNVDIMASSHGLPEFIAVAVTAGVHLWKRQMMLTIIAGTAVYMLLLHFVF